MGKRNIFTDEWVTIILRRLDARQKAKRYVPMYMKPKILTEMGEYPFRCPICRDKWLYKNQAQECLDDCWEKLPAIIWAKLDGPKEPQEIGSWQWDLTKNHGGPYCGVVSYEDGDDKCFINDGTGVRFVPLEKLLEALKTAEHLWQAGPRPLPPELAQYGKMKRPEVNPPPSFHEAVGV